MCETFVCENCDLTGERYVGGAGEFCELCNPKPMLGTASCPNCVDRSSRMYPEKCVRTLELMTKYALENADAAETDDDQAAWNIHHGYCVEVGKEIEHLRATNAELLAALKDMIVSVDQLFPTDGPVKARARMAIAKAEGARQ